MTYLEQLADYWCRRWGWPYARAYEALSTLPPRTVRSLRREMEAAS